MNTMTDINSLSLSDLKILEAQLKEKNKSLKAARDGDVNTLKTLSDDFCKNWLNRLLSFSLEQSNLVESVFQDAAPLIGLKSELYEVKESQGSHTFTARDGSGSITTGYNMIIGFDGTSDIGVQKIQSYLTSLSKDDANRNKIEKILDVLMKRNRKGELNPTRIMDLSNLKADIDDELFSEGVDIVVASQFRTRTSSYVEGWIRQISENGKETKVQFRITAK